MWIPWACGALSLSMNHANAWQEYAHPYVPGSQQRAPSGQGGYLAQPGVHGAANRALVPSEGRVYYIQRDPPTEAPPYESYEIGIDYASSRADVSGMRNRGHQSPAYGVGTPATRSYGYQDDYRPDADDWRPVLGGGVERRSLLPGAPGVYYPGITEFAAELSHDARFEYGVPIQGGTPYADSAMPSWAGSPSSADYRLPTSGPDYRSQGSAPGVYRHRRIGPHGPQQGHPSADSVPGVVRIEYWTTRD